MSGRRRSMNPGWPPFFAPERPVSLALSSAATVMLPVESGASEWARPTIVNATGSLNSITVSSGTRSGVAAAASRAVAARPSTSAPCRSCCPGGSGTAA